MKQNHTQTHLQSFKPAVIAVAGMILATNAANAQGQQTGQPTLPANRSRPNRLLPLLRTKCGGFASSSDSFSPLAVATEMAALMSMPWWRPFR